MGIDDPKGFIEKRYGKSDTKVTLLVTCVVGEAIVTEVESAVEETQSSGSWIDVMVSVQCSTYALYVSQEGCMWAVHLYLKLKVDCAIYSKTVAIFTYQ